MTHTRSALVLLALLGGAACAEDKSPPAAKPAAASTAAKPAPAGIVHYVQAAGSSLDFTFEQAGAQTRGTFRQFATALDYDAANLAASKLDVTVQIASLDTQDKDRDATLTSADLFDAQKYPTATYHASALARGANGVEAVGRLTIRGITRDVRLPLAIKPAGTGLELSGAVTIRRLDFGVGQGEWKSTDSVGDAVKISYKVVLHEARG